MLSVTAFLAVALGAYALEPEPTTLVTATVMAPTPTMPACSVTSLMPTCGIPCITAAAIKIGCTASMDFACQCKSASAMQSAVMPCVMSACGGANAPVVGSVANAICTACLPAAATATHG